MSGPLPKPADQRQRRNKPKSLSPQLTAINGELGETPDPPEAISADLAQEWSELWLSPLATSWNADTDIAALRRLYRMRDQLDRFEAEGMAEPLSAGSTGQLQIHPLLKQCDSLRAQILSLEDRFGLSPQARLKLGITLGEAHKSLDDLNRRLARGTDDDDGEDPRIHTG